MKKSEKICESQWQNKEKKMADNVQKILETMKNAGKPLKGGEIAELSGLDKKEVDKAMKQMKKEETIVSPKRCYWEPK